MSATKPDRSGKIAPVTEPLQSTFVPREVALDYLRSDQPGSPVRSGWTASDLENPKFLSEAVSSKSGIASLHLRQTVGGIEVYNADMNINVAKNGSILSAHNSFVKNVTDQITATEPDLAVEEAIAMAAQHVAVAHSEGSLQILKKPEGPAKESVFDGGDLSQDPIPTKLVYVATEAGEAKLAWNMVLHLKDGVRWLDLNIDAEDGELLTRANWYANADYRVFAQPKEHPTDGPRTLESDPHNLSASPFGWHDTNGISGAEHTDTRGNNVHAQEDTDANNSGGRRPNGTAGLVFDNPLNLATQSPPAYEDAAITNLFYWNNLIHDIMWHHGFDESAGNFQVDNYGNGGSGGDPVQADAQDGSGTNNANFGTPPDGQDPRMQMFVWTETVPNRDSDLENGIIIHEYGHGISNRLTGGPANSSALIQSQSRGMGEGWSDWFALVLTAVPTDNANTPRGIGTYVLGEPVTGPGIRPYRYTTDPGVNPQTYQNIRSGLSVPHGIGSVWCTAIWEVYWELVGAHGFDSDLYNGTGGNNVALDLIIEGMKLQPANPTYLDARDAIILADQQIYGGANNAIIWEAFAKRGMGFSALDGGSASSLNVTEAFDLPDEALSITDVSVLEGDSGTIQATFTVSLNEASADEVRVNWTTENGSAVAPTDFNAASGQLVFPSGDLSRTVSVAVKGDSNPEADEDFSVRLFNPTGASILKEIGVGTIENDDYIAPVITSSLSVLAIDGLPFQYQIEADNTARSYSIASVPAGMIVDSLTGVVTWTPPSEGIYFFDITATNPAGSDTETVQVEVLENSLQTALDIGEITIFSSLTPWALQTEITHDGTDAAQSGPVTHNEASTMQMEIQGPETIFFWWKVSSEENYDYLRFSVEGEVIDEIHGEVDWKQVRYDLPEDQSYTVRWDYDKDGSVDIGTDAGWVDKLVLLTFDPRPFITSPITGVGVKGQEFSYQIETSKPATSFSSTALPQGLSLNTNTGLISGMPVSGGNTPVTVTVSNAAGETTETLNILILELVTLPFSENFESGQIESYWAVTGTNTYRTEVSNTQFPRGNWHLLMDSSQDQSYSRNELTFYSDIRGLHDVELKFWARDYNDEEHGPPASPFIEGADFDGVAISPDRVHWYEVQPLRSQINGTYSEYTIDINAAMTARGLDYGEFFGIRFNHYDNYELSTDGFAFDDISMTGSAASVSAPTLLSSSDWGVSNSDGITGDTTPTFSGTGTAGTEVTLRSNLQGIVKKGMVNGSGNWTITTNPLSAGTHLITASVHGGAESSPFSVKIESSVPTVTVTKASGQADPASSGPVVFDIVFSEDVDGFTLSDLNVTGSIAGNVSLTGGPTNYQATIALTGSEGAVSLTVPSGAAEDIAGNQNLSSSSPDNYVEIDAHPGGSGSPTPFPLNAGSGMQSAWMEPTDTDTFTFTLDGPRMARIFTSGQVNTRGELRDGNGELVHNPNADDNAGGGSNFEIRETLRAGTYTVVVTSNNDQGSYDLHIEAVDVPMIQPDMQISGAGDDIYDTLTGQSSSLSSRRGAPVSVVSTVENDGEIMDTFMLSGARGNSTFRVNYLSPDDGNITASVVTGAHQIEDMAPNADPYSIVTSVRPSKNKIRKKLPKNRQRGGKKFKYKVRRYTTILRVVSGVSETQVDRGIIQVKTTK